MNDKWTKYDPNQGLPVIGPIWITDGKRIEWLDYDGSTTLVTTHWMPAYKPEPPKEPTQRELDESAALAQAGAICGPHTTHTYYDGARWAFHHRDEQVREILRCFGLSDLYKGNSIRMVSGAPLERLCDLVGYKPK